jgi:type VI secretion system secreted protein VgrG
MIHNGENAIPYDLPTTKTQSYIKTQTMPQYADKEGYNEILFEDAQHNEQLNLRAQKDYSLTVLNDATEHIQHDHSTTIDNNQDLTVHGYQTEQVNKAKTETIMLAKALTVGAGYQVSVGASKNETVGVSSSEEVGVYKYVHVGEKYELMVGKSKITMYANGEIIIEGDDIDITGTEHVEIIAPKIYIDDVEVKQGGNISHSITYDLKDYMEEDFSSQTYKLYSHDGEKATLLTKGALVSDQTTTKYVTEKTVETVLYAKLLDEWNIHENEE